MRTLGEVERRNAERSAAVYRFKIGRLTAGTAFCDVCEWKPPVALELAGCLSVHAMLHAHHVIPVECGGGDEYENLVLLCPTHHAIAHRVSRRSGPKGERIYFGPQAPAELLRLLNLLETDPAAAAAEIHAMHAGARAMVLAASRAQPLPDVVTIRPRVHGI